MSFAALAAALERPEVRKILGLGAVGLVALGALVDVGISSSRAPAAKAAPAAIVASTTPAPAVTPAPAPGPAIAPIKTAGAISPEQRKEIEAIIKDYLISNPEVMIEIQTALEGRMERIQAERMQAAIKENAGELFRKTNVPTVGNPDAKVTMIEFFDYNCGFCRKAMQDVAKLVEQDKDVRVMFFEFPILAKESEDVAKISLAAKAQGKYWELHRALFEASGPKNEAMALRLAEKLGLDMAKLKKDAASDEVKAEIDRVRTLAQKMGIQGTPHFLVGDKVVPGAPDNLVEVLARQVAEIRKTGCQVC